MFIIQHVNSVKKSGKRSNGYIIFRTLTWGFCKGLLKQVPQQHYSIAAGHNWNSLPKDIKNLYLVLAASIAGDYTPDGFLGFLIYRSIFWDVHHNEQIDFEIWDKMPDNIKFLYIHFYTELSERIKKQKKQTSGKKGKKSNAKRTIR